MEAWLSLTTATTATMAFRQLLLAVGELRVADEEGGRSGCAHRAGAKCGRRTDVLNLDRTMDRLFCSVSFPSFVRRDSSTMDADRRRAFAQALAQALEENERKTVDQATLLHETYVELCHDEPLVSSDHLPLLARALEQQVLRLSKPLVRGLRQLPQRLWVVHGKLPLLALQAESLEEAARWMGSFRAQRGEENDDDGLQSATEEEEDAREGQRQQDFHPLEATTAIPQPTISAPAVDELEEVWATESDPSDYCYESDWNPQQLEDLAAFEGVSIDPVALSQVPPDTSYRDIAEAIFDLLQDLDERTPLPDDPLPVTQLILTLLLEKESPILTATSFPWDRLVQTHLFPYLRTNLPAHLSCLQSLFQASCRLAASEVSYLCETLPSSPVLAEFLTEITDDWASLVEESWLSIPLLQVWAQYNHKCASRLLESGLWVQWLKLLQTSEDEALRHALTEQLSTLSLQSPTILGKYAWRFPGFEVDATAVDRWVWCYIGTRAVDPSAPTVQWKNSKVPTSTLPRTRDECLVQAKQEWITLCEAAAATLATWRDQRQHKEVDATIDWSQLPKERQKLLDWNRVVGYLRSTPWLLETFRANHDNSHTRVQELLQSFPSAPHVAKTVVEGDHDSDDEEGNQRLAPGPWQQQDQVVQQVRQMQKTLMSLLEAPQAGARMSSKAD